ncbi:hypothetical protein T484DRAFT_1833628 [Baffinella frigidus]|nr:hypothetical protein T484DRAFT_1833628 [Cryptophyta sp. CCMP2293]
MPAMVPRNPQIAWALRLHLLWDALEAQGGTLQPAAGVAAVARKGMWPRRIQPAAGVAAVARKGMWAQDGTLQPAAGVAAVRTVGSGEKGGEKGGGGKQAKGLTALFLFASVELVSDPAQAAGVLEELQTCRERIAPVKGSKGATPAKPDKSAKKSKKKAEEEEEDSDDEDEDPVAVLVEVLVSLLARPSALLRAVVRQAFRYFEGISVWCLV